MSEAPLGTRNRVGLWALTGALPLRARVALGTGALLIGGCVLAALGVELVGRALIAADGVEPAQLLSRLRMVVVVVLFLIALLGTVVAWWLAGIVLEPVRRMAEAVRGVDRHSLGERLNWAGPFDELADLASSFDGMLTRLEAAFAQEDRFIADAAHELRTPLATLRAVVENALSGAIAGTDDRSSQSALTTCHQQLVRLEQLAHDLLLLAEPARGQGDAQVWLGPIVEDVMASFRDRAEKNGIALAVRGDGALAVNADETHLARILTNLLDNALTHTPRGGRVTVSLTRDKNEIVLAVADTGVVWAFPRRPTKRSSRRFAAWIRLVRVRVVGVASGSQSFVSSHSGMAAASAS